MTFAYLCDHADVVMTACFSMTHFNGERSMTFAYLCDHADVVMTACFSMTHFNGERSMTFAYLYDHADRLSSYDGLFQYDPYRWGEILVHDFVNLCDHADLVLRRFSMTLTDGKRSSSRTFADLYDHADPLCSYDGLFQYDPYLAGRGPHRGLLPTCVTMLM